VCAYVYSYVYICTYKYTDADTNTNTETDTEIETAAIDTNRTRLFMLRDCVDSCFGIASYETPRTVAWMQAQT